VNKKWTTVFCSIAVIAFTLLLTFLYISEFVWWYKVSSFVAVGIIAICVLLARFLTYSKDKGNKK